MHHSYKQVPYPASQKADLDLDRYATLHAQTYEEAVGAATLISHILEAFIAGERGFRKDDAGKAAPSMPS
ncbi:DUF2274 domain-containing protein [Klebsiella pneumoniae]|uniref:DUF2274 domain-containing protein n=1 Tax=Klebsiella pneumoniae complex TaxID=3390273 RepID=UPI000E348015|nr:DUF2274 domain-containing protein [Klebsiella pneumoniae]